MIPRRFCLRNRTSGSFASGTPLTRVRPVLRIPYAVAYDGCIRRGFLTHCTRELFRAAILATYAEKERGWRTFPADFLGFGILLHRASGAAKAIVHNCRPGCKPTAAVWELTRRGYLRYDTLQCLRLLSRMADLMHRQLMQKIVLTDQGGGIALEANCPIHTVLCVLGAAS